MYVKCERLDYFGRGVGYSGGKVIFVYDLLPSEEAVVKVILDKKKYMVGEVLEYKVKSDVRKCSKCLYKKCGCHLDNMNYENTLEFKKNKVLDVLKRFCGIEISELKIIPSDSIYGYRNKITLKVKSGKLGYFKNGSNELIEIDRCLIASDKINDIISILRKEDLSKVREIVIRDFSPIMVSIDGIMDISKLSGVSIFMNGKVYGTDMSLATLGDYKFYATFDSFFQVNSGVCLKLYNKVLEYAGCGDTVVDLFCGCGTISTFLSKNFKRVIGIEINSSAVKCANNSLSLNKINNVQYFCGDANKLLKGLNSDCLVVDPARRGLSKDGILNILKLKPKKIVYVSCNIMSFTRDFKELSKYYNLEDITLFDMFPWTYHVESVCLLRVK